MMQSQICMLCDVVMLEYDLVYCIFVRKSDFFTKMPHCVMQRMRD